MKNIKLLITGVLTAYFSVSFTGCKDKCPPCGNDYLQIPQEMKDWALFEEGSWWVNRLAEDTTVLDTVRVVPNSLTDFRSNKSKCDDNNSLSTQCSETLTYRLQHSNTDYFPHHADTTIGGFDEIVLYYPPGGGVCLYYYGSGYGGGVIFAIDPIIVGENYGNFTLIDTFSNINYNGINTTQIFYSSIVTNNPPPGFLMQDIYWGKNVGILKLEVPPNQTWELINYEVKQ